MMRRCCSIGAMKSKRAGTGKYAGKKRAGRVAGAGRSSGLGAGLDKSGKQIEEYIAGIPESSRKTFDALRATVLQAAPRNAVEVISYGILALKTERVLVWYAAFAKHCSLFPSASVLAAFRDELKGFVVSKGTVQFPLDRPLPVGLVKKLVRARVAEGGAKRK